jgi:hypothetical protein
MRISTYLYFYKLDMRVLNVQVHNQLETVFSYVKLGSLVHELGAGDIF